MRCDHYYVHETAPNGQQVWVCTICGSVRQAVAP